MAALVILACAAAAVAFGPAKADDWPDWLRTGRLQYMGLNYSNQEPERLQAFVDMGCRLMLGGATSVAGWGTSGGDEALAGYRQFGLPAIAYSTPHTIYGDSYAEGSDDWETTPRTRDWLAVGRDGRPLRPWGTEGGRYLACINQPGWRAHNREALARLITTGAVGVFWDDAFPFACQCQVCQDRFREWLGKRYGAAEIAALGVTSDDLPAPPFVRILDMRDCRSQLDREWAVFCEASLEEFLSELRDYARSLRPGFIFSVNSSQPGVTACMLLSQNVMDQWVFEEGPHSLAPQANNSLRYLQGFARARTKPVQMLPGGEGWGNEQATPVQYAASLAEGVACGGEMMVHLGHAGEDDEVWRTVPGNAETVARYRRFFAAHEDLLAGLRPAARVAIFDSNASAFHNQEYYACLRALVGHFRYTGIPYTVINAEASPELVRQFEVVITCYARVLSDPQVQALQTYRRAGGRLINVGDAGALDERWRPRDPVPLPADVPSWTAEQAFRRLLTVDGLEGVRLEAPAGSAVMAHPWEKRDAQGPVLVVHLMNYTLTADAADVEAVPGLEVVLARGVTPRSILWETPEGEHSELQVVRRGGRLAVKLPALRVYGLLTVR